MTISDYLNNTLVVEQVASSHPLTFKNDTTSVTLPEFISKYVPEFSSGAKDQLSRVLFNGHMQTCITAVKHFEDIDQINYRRLMITYPDNGQGALDICVPKHKPTDYIPSSQLPFQSPLEDHYTYMTEKDPILHSDDNKPMLVALHGLTGGSHESYIRTILHQITTRYNFEGCVINSRGCCQSQITTPQLYNGGWTNDVRFVMDQLFQMYPNRQFYMIGFSLGASILSNYIGEQDKKISDRVKCAIVFGNPWDLVDSARTISAPRMGYHLYSPALTKNVVKLTKTHAKQLMTKPGFKNIYDEYIDTVQTVSAFDDVFTGPMFNYKDAHDYYSDASSFKRLSGVRVPLIGINALDDPIAGVDMLPEEQFKANPYTMLIETSIGGHIAWFKDLNGTRWFTDPVCNFFNKFHTEIVCKGMKPVVPVDELPTELPQPVRTTFKQQE